MKIVPSIEKLISSLNKLPGVGKKSAERMAYALLEKDKSELLDFATSLEDVANNIKKCKVCGVYSEDEVCPICLDENRDEETLMIVSYFKDVLAFESNNSFNGRYHILEGAISTTKGISIDDLNVESLYKRLEEGKIKEVIVATNPNLDGETTALYLAKKLEKYDVTITKLAYGLSIGSALDYTDSLTLSKALEGRRKV
jgi:recombination protein RecR